MLPEVFKGIRVRSDVLLHWSVKGVNAVLFGAKDDLSDLGHHSVDTSSIGESVLHNLTFSESPGLVYDLLESYTAQKYQSCDARSESAG
jgi:hypothetical protein